jgi:hypothetical protein
MVTHPAWLLLYAAALAPPSPPTAASDQTIIVTGAKPTPDAVARYVDSITADIDGQIATFRQPICPAAFGLPEAYNRVIERRLREVTGQIGLRTAAAKCDPNLVVIVGEGGPALIERLRKDRPDAFAGLEFAQVRDVAHQLGPVRTWHSVEPRGADGRPLERVSFLDNGTGHLLYIGEAYYQRATTSASSRIEQSVRQDIVRSFVQFDVDAIDGLTLTQIADYAAMVAFAITRVPADFSGPTILRLFDNSPNKGAPSRLTRWDIAYLRALYATNNSRPAHTQQAAIAGAIRRDLEPER